MSARRAGAQIEQTLKSRLKALGNTLAQKVRKYGHQSSKVAKEDDSRYDLMLILEDAMGKEWELIAEEIDSDLEEVAAEGAREAMVQLEIDDSGLLSDANEIAREWANERAAELVGMKRVKGKLVENPNAEWSISETTRDEIRDLVTEAFEKRTTIEELADSIKESSAFSEQRAEMIARTEVARAEVEGNKAGWISSGIVKAVEWILSADHDDASGCECTSLAVGGPYPIKRAPACPAHPNCYCGLVPVLD